jgi:hypothetical protein
VALFLFLLSLFGLMSALRLSREFLSRALISKSLVTKTGTLACTVALLGVFFCAHNTFAAILSAIGAPIAAAIVLLALERRQIDTLKLQTPLFLDRWILNMRLGASVSSAREAALRDSAERLRALLQPMFKADAQTPREHSFLPSKFLLELKNLSLSPHSALARLENLREMMRKSDDFRRKSGQARRQTSIQAGVLLCLHLALAIFTYRRYGWQRHSDLIVMSFVLAGCGLAVMNRLARKTKWKI